MENKKIALVQKSGSRNTPMGHLKPIYTINDNGIHEKVGYDMIRKEKFPNIGTIVVLKNYNEIFYNFKKYELFKIEYEESPRFEESIPNSCKYQSLHADTSTYEKLPLIIKQSRLLTINDPITLPYQYHRYVFIELDEFLYGPYAIQPEGFNDQIDDDDDDYDDDVEDSESFNEVITNDEANNYNYFVTANENTDEIQLDISFANSVLKFAKSDVEKYIVTNQKNRTDVDYCLFDLKKIIKEVDPVDYVLNESDAEVIKWIDKFSLPKSFSTEDAEQFLSTSNDKNPIHRRRFEKYASIKEKNTNWINFIDSYLKQNFFKSELGQEKLEQYIENNKEDLILEKSEQIKDQAQLRNKKFDEELEKLKIEFSEENQRIEKLRADRDKLLNEQEIIKAKNEEFQRIESEINTKKEELKIYTGLEEAERRYDDGLKSYNKIENKITEKENELERLKTLTKEQSEKRLEELYLYVRAITEGQESSKGLEIKNSLITQSEIKKINKEITDLKTYFIEAGKFLKSKNRNFTDLEVVNFLTCINQNFVTVLVGLPGVGKTSLSNLLAEFICPGIFSLEIPVGRGWSTKKNLLGFFNPLKNEYQSDEYGLMERIKEFNHNPEILNIVPLVVILDEANLSPIEHYWSDFISLCDENKYGNRFINSLDVNGNLRLKLPDGFKFIFTVNHDHTTELLSPRLLDRACMIKLDLKKNSKNSDEGSDQELAEQLNTFYSEGSINSHFRPKKSSFSLNEEKLFDEILNILTESDYKNLGKQIPVSPRKIKAITLYCSVSRDIYKEFGGTQFTALDFAILQNLIPLINGQGNGFEKRLQNLKKFLEQKSLIKSAKEIEEILGKGQDFQYYSYF